MEPEAEDRSAMIENAKQCNSTRALDAAAEHATKAALGMAPACKPALANLLRVASCWNKDRRAVLDDGD